MGGRARHTLEQFIESASKVHNNFYDYSQSEYIKADYMIKVVCPDHGPFYPTPRNHVSKKSGCPSCYKLVQRLPLSHYIDRWNKAHNFAYDYSLATNENKFTVICKKHGQFIANRRLHERNACAKCNPKGGKLSTTEKFITKARTIHTNPSYDYSLTDYKSSKQSVAIICKFHGIFWQGAACHIQGRGCPYCNKERISYTQEQFLEKAKAKHGDTYDYSLVEYRKAKLPVKIKCIKHGIYEQTPHAHMQGRGCSGCVSGGFDQTKLSHIYILKSEFPDITKIGVTNNDPSIRCSQINSDANKIDINFDLYWKSGLISGVDCLKVETAMLKWAKTIYKKPTVNFDGCTEAFIDLPAMTAYERIQELLGSVT